MAVFDNIEKFGEAPAVIDAEGSAFSYISLTQLADSLCNGLQPRSLVAIVTSNSVGSIAAYVGCLRRGIVPILLPNTIKPEGLAEICNTYKPNALFSPADETPSAHATIAGYKCVSLDASGGDIHDDLALLISTSGSTGSKTMVRLSAQNIACNANQIIEYLEIAPSDRVITTMPMSYSYGLSLINTHLLSGAAVIATDEPLMSPRFWSLLKEQKASTFGGVPFIYEMLKKLRFNKMDLPSLRYLTQAGGKLSSELTKYFMAACHQKSIDFTVMYGQTEATARISYVPANDLTNKIGSIGIPIPNMEMWLEDETGARISQPGQDGEIVVKGQNVSLGAAETKADLALGDEQNATLHTGDIAYQDEDGFFFIVGRKKRFLKLYGNRVNLAELETALETHGMITACTGYDDHLYVFAEEGTETNLIKDTLKAHTSVPPKAIKVVVIDKFPRSDSDKISYHLLNQMIEAG